MTEIRDYNGKGRWSSESIQRRFDSYAETLGTKVASIKGKIYEEGSVRWIYPMMFEVIEGMKQGDPACLELGLELIEESDSMPFGKILKSNAARALKRSSKLLTEDQKRRIRIRVGDMLISKYMPREFVMYVKLVKSVGFEEEIPRVIAEADCENYWVSHYLDKLGYRDVADDKSNSKLRV